MSAQAVEMAKDSLEIWQQYPIPTEAEAKTESQAIWRNFLLGNRIAYNTLCATPQR
jgi:hypothetical protein